VYNITSSAAAKAEPTRQVARIRKIGFIPPPNAIETQSQQRIERFPNKNLEDGNQAEP
jgi:hypothetical protein